MGGALGASAAPAAPKHPSQTLHTSRPIPWVTRSERCHALQRVHLELPPPPVPLLAASEAVARAVAGEPWAPAWPAALAGGQPGGNPGALADSEYPPVDGYLLKLLAQVRSPPGWYLLLFSNGSC